MESQFSEFKVPLTFMEQRRGIIINPTRTENIETIAKQIFQIQEPFTIKTKSDNTQIIFTSEVIRSDELFIELFQSDIPSNPLQGPARQITSLAQSQEKDIEIKINIKTLKEKVYQGLSLIEDLNDSWALPLGFKLRFSQGVKAYEKVLNRTMRCCNSLCQFKLTFLSSKPLNYDALTREEKKQICKNLDFILSEADSFDTHNHTLNYVMRVKFTPEMISDIDYFKGRVKTMTELQLYLNKKYNTYFKYSAVVNQVYKLMDLNFGNASKDAASFVEEVRKDILLRGGTYRMEEDSKTKELKKILYVSGVMLSYKDKFLDIIIVDSTYKRNRFNMPVVNVIGVNNFGRNILLAFCLLNEETTSSYDWLFKNLKDIWKKEPTCIISDESQAIISGKFFCFFCLIIIRNQTKFSLKKITMCMAHSEESSIELFFFEQRRD